MHDDARILDGRVHRHLTEKIIPASFTTVAELSVEAAPLTDNEAAIGVAAAPGVEGQGEPIPAVEAMALEYQPFEIGQPWGPAWGTTWFRMSTWVPEELRDQHLEIHVDLGAEKFSTGFQCEGLVYRTDGSIIKAHNPLNTWVPVEIDGDGNVMFYLEAAANPTVLGEDPAFAETPVGTKAGAGPAPRYVLRAAELRIIHDQVRELAKEVAALSEVAEQLPEDSGRRWEIRRALDRALNQLQLSQIQATAAAARKELVEVLARPATASAHQLHAVGHAHIDSAWLWPLRETRRKVARTIANQLNLLATHPEHRFAFPAAQHSRWLEEDQPELFARLQEAVKNGHIIPVGGMWVESDANLPGGEAMARQFLYGRTYFREAFDAYCPEVWLPDSFGYSAALPQLAKLAGARWFLTQKISWNQVNKFPHHSFWWEGIDGTRIFTHFPPADTYNSELDAANLSHAERNFRDKGRSSVSLVPFGWGDGGGGPTREMLERVPLVADLEGAPKLQVSTPSAFFTAAEANHEDPTVWVGELYLELHRGTFTSVAEVKRGNRTNEHLLREAELWTATAAVRGLMDYPLERFEQLWREVLLYQFHDILPGTCISWVYSDVLVRHRELNAEIEELIGQAQQLLAGEGDQLVAFNGGPGTRDGVPALGAAVAESPAGQVAVTGQDGTFTIANDVVRVTVEEGAITGLLDLATGRETVPPSMRASVLQLMEDFPNEWDAWDIDAHDFATAREVPVTAVEAITDGVVISYDLGESSATQTITLRAGDPRVFITVDVEWRHRDSLLKLAWPVDVHADLARCEIEMGHITRPTHTNTSWEAQRFEVHAHRWVHVGEDDYGFAVANSRTYGWDFSRDARQGGGTFTTIRASLLKGPRFPDPSADIGQHQFQFTLRPGATIEDAVADGYDANLQLREVQGQPVEPLVALDGPVQVEAIKLAEDGSGDVIVRLYEPYGRRAQAIIRPSFEASDVTETDLLEAPLDPSNPEQQVAPSVIVGGSATETQLALRPFQIATLRWRRSA